MKNFKKLLLWQKSIEVAKETYKLTSSFPTSERYGMISQMNRSAVPVPSNIAEGSSRRSEKDYRRFLEIALGSSFELETQLIISKETKLGNAADIEQLIEKGNEVGMMITGFIKRLRS